MVAVEVVPDDHVTEVVKFCVLLSVYVPVAVNCCVRPLVIVGFAGVTAIDCRVAAVTVSTVEPTTPSVALIVLVPTPAPVAKPPVVMVAVPGVPDAHVICEVRFCVLLSL
jgi:hypothetical protein